MLLGPNDVLWIGAVPSIVAAVAMWVCLRLRAGATVAWTASIASGLVVGMVARNARDGWPVALDQLLHPRVAFDWLPWLVLVAAGMGLLAEYAPRSWREIMTLAGFPIMALAGMFAIAVPMRLLAGNASAMSRWSAAEKLGVLAIWTCAFAALWLTFALGRQNRLPLVRSGLLLVVTLGISITLAASGAITFGELGGIAAATLLGTIAVAWWCDKTGDGPTSAAGPLAVMLGGLILVGYFYSQLTATNAALLSIALAASAGWLPGKWPAKPAWQIALRTILTLVPLAIAVISAVNAAVGNYYGNYG